MRVAQTLVLVASIVVLAPREAASQSPVRITAVPDPAYIERDIGSQYVNFDLVFENTGNERLRVNRIDLVVLDKAGAVAVRRYLSVSNGMSPGIQTIPSLTIEPRRMITIFNPFFSFAADVDLNTLSYDFTFDGDGRRFRTSVVVKPVHYEPKTDLILPLKGRVLVYDGHDFYSHHRRVDIARIWSRGLRLQDTPVRYAYDLCTVNERAEPYVGDPNEKTNWLCYGASVYASGAGTVVSSANDVPDNVLRDGAFVPPPGAPTDRTSQSIGNHVIIDHGNGEFSVFAHLKPGSVTVRRGDSVNQGQMIGAIGISGEGGPVDAFHVHLHYHVALGAQFDSSRGAPSEFSHFRRHLGKRTVDIRRGRIDTGDIVESMR
jgi:hypothetical protein